MAIGGLVISLSSEPSDREAAMAWIDRDPRLEVGPSHADRIAVVIETPSLGEGRDLCDALLEHDGVIDLQLAFLSEEDKA